MEKQYDVLRFNIQDSNVGEFTYKVRLSDHIDFDKNTGYLYCRDAIVGNVGVQTYKGYELGFSDGNRIVKVHRKREYIFAKDSLESLRGKPITLEHPKVMVDSTNFKTYGMGTILDVGREVGDNILCDLVIQDKELVEKVAPEGEDGVRRISSDFRDLSLGYNAKLLPYQDTDEYVQTDIEYNHLAVVREGRAANATIVDSENPEAKEKTMEKPKLVERIKGLFFKKKNDGSVVIQDEETNEEQVVSVSEYTEHREYIDPYEHDKKITVERKTTEIVKEDDGEDAKVEAPESEEKKEKEDMKDQAYFDQAFKDAMALPAGAFKDDRIEALNKEYLEAFPRAVKDSKPAGPSVLEKVKVTDSSLITKDIKDEKSKTVDFDHMEKESSDYYRKLTDPEFWDSHDSWKKYYNSEVRSGKAALNL